jgi:hypothetical protein
LVREFHPALPLLLILPLLLAVQLEALLHSMLYFWLFIQVCLVLEFPFASLQQKLVIKQGVLEGNCMSANVIEKRS